MTGVDAKTTDVDVSIADIDSSIEGMIILDLPCR